MRLPDGIFARGAAAQAASEHAFFQALLAMLLASPPAGDAVCCRVLERLDLPLATSTGNLRSPTAMSSRYPPLAHRALDCAGAPCA